MDRVICLIGRSGSGKTTLANRLEDNGLNVIHSYTNRPKRHENETGHIFIDGEVHITDEYIAFNNKAFPKEELMAHMELYGNHYFALQHQYIFRGDSIYVVDPQGFQAVRENVTDAEVIGIYLSVDKLEIETRLATRYYNDSIPAHIHEKVSLAQFLDDYLMTRAFNVPHTLQNKCCEIEDMAYRCCLNAAQKYVSDRMFPDDFIFDKVAADYTVDGNYSINDTYKKVLEIIKRG